MIDQMLPVRLDWNDVYLVTTQDGSNTLYNRALSSAYHSMHGAVSESRHVFLQQGLHAVALKNPLQILEFGFGTGLNAFLAYLYSVRNNIRIHYTGLELFPIDNKVAAQLDYPAYLVATEHTDVFHKMHEEISFTTQTFDFKKHPDWNGLDGSSSFDCIFFDAFAPAIQGALWEEHVFEVLYMLTAPGGCLVTYCAQGEVRRRMERIGFKVERLAGSPGKREMLRAWKGIESL
jgi:tRNA U34 5-methylaminomethyl-2-thiouridine-forming methyltransferase MnmC